MSFDLAIRGIVLEGGGNPAAAARPPPTAVRRRRWIQWGYSEDTVGIQ